MGSRIHLRLTAGAIVLSLPVLATSTDIVGGGQVHGVLASGSSGGSATVFTGAFGRQAADPYGDTRPGAATKHLTSTGNHRLQSASPTPPSRLAGVSLDALDIPATALVAYQVAAATMAQADPSCKVDWALLAAIGRVESNHGRYGGATLSPNGIAHPAIRGVALNGKGPVAAVPDTDGGSLDGDKVWDRAVGPMQFLPSTWAYAGVDADGDGVRSPDDINDAALAAAVYLCAAPGNLDRLSGLRAAVHRYNASSAYVDLVVQLADAYRNGDVAGISGGTTLALGSTQIGSPWSDGSSTGPGADHGPDGPGTAGGRGNRNGGDGTAGSQDQGRGTAHTQEPVQALPDSGTETPLPGPKDGNQPTETPTPHVDPPPSPDPEPTQQPQPSQQPQPTQDPQPSEDPQPTQEPSTKPTPSPEPEPQLVSLSGVLSSSGSQWYLAGDALDVGDASWLATTAFADFDHNGAVESNGDELTGLVGTEVSAEVEPDTAIVHILNGSTYR